MFGHDDNDNKDEDTLATPSPDATLDSASTATTGPSDDSPADAGSDSPAYVTSPSVGDAAATTAEEPAAKPEPAAHGPAATVPADLLDIKQSALKQLTPLVGHLNQTPEEKFRTTMMMIQAADDQTLIKDAYDAAQNISDEKTKAQALLDIINEINYFTQQS